MKRRYNDQSIVGNEEDKQAFVGLFAKGQKGAIKVTQIVSGYSGYVVFDLKMQKYPN